MESVNELPPHVGDAAAQQLQYLAPYLRQLIRAEDELTQVWRKELDSMCDRINNMRRQLVDNLQPHGLDEQFSFVADQRGMFSYTGLDKTQVERLRDDFSIYMVGSGRANVAGLNDDNIKYVYNAIAEVVGKG